MIILYIFTLLCTSFAFYALGKSIGEVEGFYKGRKTERAVWINEFEKLSTKSKS